MSTLVDRAESTPHNDHLNEPIPEQPIQDTAPETDEPAQATDEPANDAPVCRICLMSADEAPELGKLIKPCLCKGTVGHVHVQCLNTWRKASASRRAFWQCDQCGYKYQLVRTRALGIAQSRFVVGCSTVTLFTILVFATSFFFSLFLPSGWIDGTSSTVANLVDNSVGDSSSWTYYYVSPSMIANSMWKVAYQTLNDLFDDVIAPSPHSADSSTYRYKAEPRRVKPKRKAHESRVRTADDPAPVPGAGARTGPFKSTVSVPRSAAEQPVRLNAQYDDDDREHDDAPRRPGFLVRLIRRFLLGLSVVGAFSFMSFGVTLTMPLQWARRRAAGGRRGEGRDTSIYAIIILVMILVGAAKAMYSTYKLTKALTTELLKRAETAILEVGSDQPVPLNEPDSINVRASLARMRTRAFWRECWWDLIRLLRGAKDSIAALLHEIRWLDVAAVLTGVFLVLFGGGAWVWQV